MTRSLLLVAIVILVLLLACGGGQESASTMDRSSRSVADESVEAQLFREAEVVREVVVEREVMKEVPREAMARAAEPAMGGFAPDAFEGPAGAAGARQPLRIGESSNSLQTIQREVISSASLSLEVEDVQGATAQVRVIAEGSGGLVEQLSSSGRPGRQRAHVTIRVLQDQFNPALERIEALGIIESRELGSEDVSEQFIDLEARLKSALREEQSLLKLLERAGVVSEILAIERELARVRSEIERFQGRLNFLERRVDLATISVTLFSPEIRVGEPPSAALNVVVQDVSGTVDSVKALSASLNGEVDRVFLLVRDGQERATLSLRLFTGQFQQAMDFLESQGEVKQKELTEGTAPPEGSAAPAEEPDAHIDISLVEKGSSVNAGLIAAIAGPLGGIALAGVLALLMVTVYRAGRRNS